MALLLLGLLDVFDPKTNQTHKLVLKLGHCLLDASAKLREHGLGLFNSSVLHKVNFFLSC
jgi:hypothetical protein